MKRIFYIPFVILLLPCNFLFSQDTPDKFMLEVSVIAARDAAGGLTYDNIEGNPHYSDAFIESIVYMKDGRTASLPLRYDLFQDEIEFKRENKNYWIFKNDVLYIQYGKELLFPEPFSKTPGKSTYFFAKERGKYALFIRKKVSFHPKTPSQGYSESLPDRFERDNDEFYLKQSDMPAIEIINKKTLLEMLSDNAAALDYIKKSKIKANKEEDLIELVRFLNNQ
jgi:hypothetical protein